jgi:hypothetical protein
MQVSNFYIIPKDIIKEIFKEEMPSVVTLFSIPSKNSFPEVEIARNSSNSAFNA